MLSAGTGNLRWFKNLEFNRSFSKWEIPIKFQQPKFVFYAVNAKKTEVNLSVTYVRSNLAAEIFWSKGYIRLLCYKRGLDRVAEIENEIKQDFENGWPVKNLAKEPGHLDSKTYNLRGDSHKNRTGVLIGNFEKNP